MCNPLAIAGAALAGGSMLTNSIAQQEVQAARNKVLQQQAAAQQGYFNNEMGAVQHAQTGFGNAAQNGQQLGQTLGSAFQSNIPTGQTKYQGPDPTLAGANDPTVQRLAQQYQQDTQNYSNGNAANLGRLRGQTQALSDASLNASNDYNNVAMNQGFSRGESSILPYQLQDANNAAGFLPTLGNIFQMGGTALMGAGTAGGAAGLGSGASGSGIGSWAQDVFGSDPGSLGRWLAGNAGQTVSSTPFGPPLP